MWLVERQTQEIRMYQQAKLTNDLDTLPLFSGTAQREPERKAQVQAKPQQTGFFSCSVCFDTGTVKVDGKTKRCWCQG